MPEANPRAARLIAVASLALLASYLLFRADQPIFGLPSDFLGGLIAVIGVAYFATGVALFFKLLRPAS
jgi:F0F1-type ATP synthase assembly protein I